MLTEERYAAILKLLEEKKAVSVLELTELLNSSESTIRRDLTALHRMGKLTKVHGGATSINGVYQVTEDKPLSATTSMWRKRTASRNVPPPWYIRTILCSWMQALPPSG